MPASTGAQSRGPSPNRGGAVKDTRAAPNPKNADEWRKENGIDVSKQIRLVKLSHMRYQHKDFAKIQIFMKGTAYAKDPFHPLLFFSPPPLHFPCPSHRPISVS